MRQNITSDQALMLLRKLTAIPACAEAIHKLAASHFGYGKGEKMTQPLVAYQEDLSRLRAGDPDALSQLMLIAGIGDSESMTAIRGGLNTIASNMAGVPTSVVRPSMSHRVAALDYAPRPPEGSSSHGLGVDPRLHARPEFLRAILPIAQEMWSKYGLQTVVEDNHLHMHHLASLRRHADIPKLPDTAALVKINLQKGYKRTHEEELVDRGLEANGKLRVLNADYIASLPPLDYAKRANLMRGAPAVSSALRPHAHSH